MKLTFITIALFIFCSIAAQGQILKRDVTLIPYPVSTTLIKYIPLSDLSKKSPAERREWFAANGYTLERRFIKLLQQVGYGYFAKDGIEEVVFLYGSAENVMVEDKNENRHYGYFQNQLIAEVYTTTYKKPFRYILSTMSGVIFSKEEDLNSFEVFRVKMSDA